ncbi:hypothetical protein EOI86_06660 [Hwanghaeella grinnelliae]|uniref:Uncharacterized protein n=1 Tax=Hwanghaeella grinnelliae TaxID=2500179 RepID=A0A437QWN2_9PROT|nr:hypothetical protein [Hwanghaeella grinnelliae]RVU38940.1 hypothetical protein EOI86_06660 [Hwanghaeella grinnelliae]
MVGSVPLAEAQNAAVTPKGDGGVTVEGADEGAAEFKQIFQFGKKKPQTVAPKKPSMDYDAEIKKAKAAGDYFKAAILKNCQRVSPGTTLTTSPATAAIMRQYCTPRDFDIAVDAKQLHKGPIRTDPPVAAKQESGRQPDPAVEACRRETLDHVITCAKVTDYQNCETWGCPEIIQCDKRLTSCDDHGSPYNESGNFYCDTRNWRTRDFDLNALLARTCPGG